jgi:hopanoid-associated phosphorylase
VGGGGAQRRYGEGLTAGAGRVVAVTGLAVEAAIARASGVRCVVGATDPARLAADLDHALSRGARAIVSFGIAGALIDGLPAGAWLVGRAVIGASACVLTSPEWRDALVRRLPGARVVDVTGSDGIATTPHAKRDIHAATGASAIDMESHVVAHVALARGLPFAVLRVVSDPVHRAVPDAARVGLDARGKADARAVLRALCGAPRQALPLARTALDAGVALRALSAARRRLGPGLAYPDLGELPVDVA